jgi:hypothetical protein
MKKFYKRDGYPPSRFLDRHLMTWLASLVRLGYLPGLQRPNDLRQFS